MKQKLQTLCVALLALVLCNTPLFAHDFTVDGIYYNITSDTDKTVAVTYRGNNASSYSDRYSGAVTIPESVTYDGNTYSVTSIGTGAFNGCSSLTSVEIPNSVTSIGSSAFYECSSLTSVEIPNSVTSIESYAFSYCSSLISVVIGNSVTSIGDAAFRYCSSLTSVEIPNSVTSIGDAAFSGCDLNLLIVGAGVTSIGLYQSSPKKIIWLCDTPPSNAFTLEGTINYVPNDKYMLTNKQVYTHLSSMFEVDGVIYVPVDLSARTCDAISCNYEKDATAINIGQTVKYKKVDLKVKDLKPYLCYRNNYIRETTIALDGEVANYNFYKCLNLETVNIDGASVANEVFYGCSKLREVSVNGETIGNSAFAQCQSLETAILGDKLTSIGDYAFLDCTSLTEMKCYAEVPPTCGTTALTDISKWDCTLHVYDLFATDYAAAPQWKDFLFIEEIPTTSEPIVGGNIEVTDGTMSEFSILFDTQAETFVYNRTLPNLKWNALYLPVEIPVEALSDNYDVAYFNDMHAYDRDDDGTVEEMDMEIFLIKEGTLHANHPYFIRAKSDAAKQMTLELNDVTLYSTHAVNCTSITASSAYMDFELTGIYTRHMAEDLPGCYAITGSGAWAPIAAGSYLNPFRFYLKMTNRNGTPVKVNEALKSIRIRVHGEDDTTNIDNMTINGQQPTVIYDLQGRRVSNPGKGLYIVNGKKVMLK